MKDIPFRTRVLPDSSYGHVCEAGDGCKTYTKTDVVVQVYDYTEQQWSEPQVYCPPHLKEMTGWIKSLTEKIKG